MRSGASKWLASDHAGCRSGADKLGTVGGSSGLLSKQATTVVVFAPVLGFRTKLETAAVPQPPRSLDPLPDY